MEKPKPFRWIHFSLSSSVHAIELFINGKLVRSQWLSKIDKYVIGDSCVSVGCNFREHIPKSHLLGLVQNITVWYSILSKEMVEAFHINHNVSYILPDQTDELDVVFSWDFGVVKHKQSIPAGIVDASIWVLDIANAGTPMAIDGAILSNQIVVLSNQSQKEVRSLLKTSPFASRYSSAFSPSLKNFKFFISSIQDPDDSIVDSGRGTIIYILSAIVFSSCYVISCCIKKRLQERRLLHLKLQKVN
jgi:hypothetical protein